MSYINRNSTNWCHCALTWIFQSQTHLYYVPY